MHGRALAAAAVMMVLAGCQTPYQEDGFTGGVTASPLGENIYRISARGNGYTSSTTIQDYALLKSAETALATNHTHFMIIGGQDASTQSFGSTPG